MGKINTPKPVKLFIGIIAKDEGLIEHCISVIETDYGNTDTKSKIEPFICTDYYEPEMGKGLLRQWVSFEKLIGLSSFSSVKLYTDNLEKKHLDGRRRKINLDPGYLNLARIVLASTKDFSHRIYLSNGIYAEVALIYKNKEFTDLAWTYPDYKTKQAKEYFGIIRNLYKLQI